jgi:DNA polymerase I-like protein with 3'-5' exonuclease and polymerase domains
MEKLAKKHPKIDVLRDRVALSKATRRLSTELAVEPDGVGRVHFAYSLHRTNTGRLASGSDDVDADKIRVSPGNAQNKSDRDRMMYTAPPGYVFVQADYSQIESRVCAWHANDMALLDAWEKGADVYAEIAAKLYRVPVEETRNKYIWFMGDHRSLRDAGKRAHLALCYYMQPPRMADLFDIPLHEAVRLSDQWKASRVAICRWQQAQIEAASSSFEGVINSFGRRFWFPKKRTDEGWVVADPAAAVAAKPQSDVGDMCKVVLPLVNAIEGGELVTTTHDSFALYVKDEPTLVARVAHELKGVLERAWPEFGFRNINGKPGRFRCPVEIAVGKNWAKHHEHNPKCEVPCKKVENPQGLKEYKCAH